MRWTCYYVGPMAEHPLSALPPRGKDPFSATVLNQWIQQAATKAEMALVIAEYNSKECHPRAGRASESHGQPRGRH
jgi:hypothetical protein